MRTPLVAGNWKMNLQRAEAIALARGIAAAAPRAGVETLLCPPALFLYDVRAAIDGSPAQLGAQDLYWEEKGAFTGETSVTQVAEVATHVIIGHSERRQYFCESDDTVNRKVRSAVSHQLTPVMCVGESLEQRQSGATREVLGRQVRDGLRDIEFGSTLVVAYEPVWAIGTGHAADGATAPETIAHIRSTLRELCGDAADSVRILYGGSVAPDNAAEHLGQPDIDGALVGGASLKVDSVMAIVRAAAATVRRD
jgi:triosephosphate isomerase